MSIFGQFLGVLGVIFYEIQTWTWVLILKLQFNAAFYKIYIAHDLKTH